MSTGAQINFDPRTAFVPEYVMVIEHPKEWSENQIRTTSNEALSEANAKLERKCELLEDISAQNIKIVRVHTIFPENLSFQFAASIIMFNIQGLHRLPPDNDEESRRKKRMEILRKLFQLYRLIPSTDSSVLNNPGRGDTFKIISISINWIGHAGANPDVGGPGGRPRQPAEARAKGKLPRIVDAKDETPWRSDNTASDVYVAVLDTAPTRSQINVAFNKSASGEVANPLLQHALMGDKPLLALTTELELGKDDANRLKSLIGDAYVTNAQEPDKGFSVLYDTWDVIGRDLEDSKEYHMRGHSYRMPDHGLFVSGLVKSITPEANLCLVEVLNAYGVSTLESICAGLIKLWNFWKQNYPAAKEPQQLSKRKLIINSSLCLDVDATQDLTSLDAHPNQRQRILRQTTNEDALFKDYNQCVHESHKVNDEEFQTFVQRAVEPIRYLLGPKFFDIRRDDLDKRDKDAVPHVMVAAAGNGRIVNKDRETSYFPASDRNVLGVAALATREEGQKWEVAKYSNDADDPISDGIYVLGGTSGPMPAQRDDNAPDTSIDKGLIGLFLGDFPPSLGGRSDFGLGEWSGTSFATPIVTGIIASLIAGKDNTPITHLLSDSYAPKVIDYVDDARLGETPPEIHLLAVKQLPK